MILNGTNYSTSNPDDFLRIVQSLYQNDQISSKEEAIQFLDYSSTPDYLTALSSDELRNEWAELCYKLIRKYNYKLLDLISSRVNEMPDKILFQDMSESSRGKWTYKRISHYIKELAASFYDVVSESKDNQPRVAILSENSVASACCDIACLCYDIFVSPLNVSFNRETLTYIIETLNINIIVTDDKHKIETLLSIKNEAGIDLKIFSTVSDFLELADDILFLGEYETKFNAEEIDSILAKRNILDVNQVCTVMFTSGSTGMPKGLSFTMFNLITKRFARGAAVPYVGKDEVTLSYLPLYHTFGRYLEMMGTIYWRGTYTFAGNTSADTLLNLFPKIEPSIFISIPLRWAQLYEKSVELMSDVSESAELKRIFRSVVGGRLKWGLSAAGYLDPKVFTFFGKNNVELCSGFGMTEATGGITMTPPGAYKEGTVGKPLPGVITRINEEGVLEISGHYVAKYLDDAKPFSHVPYPDEEEIYISTGDVFKCDSDGFYEIVDRVKDIYKNNKGQTVSPKNVENKFESVPGIKCTFLVGDGRPYNTLFIVPDLNEELVANMSQNEINDYFHLIIMRANLQLVPYERIVNFTVLNRDFSAELGELTPKGSFNRKNIEKNFSAEIEKLYIKNHLDLSYENYIIRIPRWFFRDMGILENDISSFNAGLFNARHNKQLKLHKVSENQIQIGDLIYELSSKVINLGTLARQPKLWIGNPNLISFCPIKEGWDTEFEGISENVFLPYSPKSEYSPDTQLLLNIKLSYGLADINNYVCNTFFADYDLAISSLENLEKLLEKSNERFIHIIRKRLESLARHPEENIRAEAYKILLLDEPSPDYSKAFPAFVKSGLSYLNENSIKKIASGKLEIRRLEALRKRLLAYRTVIELPNEKFLIKQFKNLFDLLYNFLEKNPEYYTSVRYELISWMLYNKIPEISQAAEVYFKRMHEFFENLLDTTTTKFSEELWNTKLVFDDGIPQEEIDLIKHILINRAFLKQSIMLCFDEHDYSINDVKDRGAWISRLNTGSAILHYRIVIAQKNNRRYDLQFFINRDSDEQEILHTILRHVAISGYPYGYRVLPKLGAYRQELRAWSFEYFGELSLWAKIREFSSQRISGHDFNKAESLRKFYILGISAFFTGWRNSGKAILPGIISPHNVVIPELDFRDGAIINSINGWQIYTKPTLFINSIIRNFYEKAIIHYPWLSQVLEIRWIFDAVLEAIGIQEAKIFLKELSNDLVGEIADVHHHKIKAELDVFLYSLDKYYHPPLRINNAIERYSEWLAFNPDATLIAKEQTIRELISLYNIDINKETDRFTLFRYTYFKDSRPQVQKVFGDIINRLYRNTEERATHLTELTELQSLLDNSEDRLMLSRMLFPKGNFGEMSIIKSASSESSGAIIKSFIKDMAGEVYTFREAFSASEVGNLFRIFFKEKYPKVISEQDEYFVLTDSIDRIVGGMCYRKTDSASVLIDGSVVISSLSNRGLGTAMLEDFCARMASQNYESVKAHFFLKNFYIKRGFTVDRRHGTLVRFLNLKVNSNIKGNYCLI